MSPVEIERFEVVELATGNSVVLTREYPIVDGVRRLAANARTPDGTVVIKYDDGIYRSDDGREFRDPIPGDGHS